MAFDFKDYYFHYALKMIDGQPGLDTDALDKRQEGAHLFHYTPERWADDIYKNSCWTNIESDVPFYVNEVTGMGLERIKWRARWVFPFADGERLVKNFQFPDRRIVSWEYNNRMPVPADQLEWVQIA
ncbi:hypothetical protein HFN59_02270 [Rhizobium leguminosarum]|uniref:hypothetical protein n=1 Tax=Rhizobium leguminosarum TaxID=384 RepID=UPI001C96A2BE|nr:hypothetical protein [Rhizobium leguminosarum]MBY5775949.1 hypothetical protein [Rhizobium leguminosarum]